MEAVRVLLPHAREEPLDELYGGLVFPQREDRPYVYVNMVATADGAAHVGGRTLGMGSPADRLAFRRLREACDVVLVGAGTVRAERYGPPDPGPDGQLRRRQRGLAPVPRLAVVSRRLELDPAAKLFSHPQHRPLVLTTDQAPPQQVERLRRVAEVVPCGAGQVDLAEALRRLRAQGVRWVLCEGGPTLNAQLFRDQLVDELFLTISPLVVGGQAGRILSGPVEVPIRLELRELREYRGELLARYAPVA